MVVRIQDKMYAWDVRPYGEQASARHRLAACGDTAHARVYLFVPFPLSDIASVLVQSRRPPPL